MRVPRLLAASMLLAVACSRGHGVDRDAGIPDAAFRDVSHGDATHACPDACPLGEACVDGACCPFDKTGDGTCCGDREVCEGTTCAPDCEGFGPRCGSPAMCCATGEVCHLGDCVSPGATCGGSVELSCVSDPSCPDGEYCERVIGRCLPRAPTGACEVRPELGAMDIVVEWEWTGDAVDEPAHDQVVMAPSVADLDGDCMPDIVFHSFRDAANCGNGVLRAIRGDGSGPLFSVTSPALRTIPISSIAIGNIDDDPEPEIVTCGDGGGTCYSDTRAGPLLALEHDGTLKWISTDPRIVCGSPSAPAIADLDGDGRSEILVRYVVVNGDDGTVRWVGRASTAPWIAPEDFATAADLDGDGALEVVGGRYAWYHDGREYFTSVIPEDGYPAIGNLDDDPAPDVVVASPIVPWVYALSADGSPLWGPIDTGARCGARTVGHGPPTIADFDGDGEADVGVVGPCGYVALRGRDGSILWTADTDDESQASTGSAVFDFDGDGRAEVLYADETSLRIFDGSDGAVLATVCNTSATGNELPVVVDVDADDHAEIVIASNSTCPWCESCADGSRTNGVRVLGDRHNRWVRTRRIWNQHGYHVTNVNDDGSIPTHETPNWTVPGLNNFRQNVQVEGLFNAPDLVIADFAADLDRCSTELGFQLRVVNRGAAGAPAGVLVALYRGPFAPSSPIVATALTTRALLPGESELVTLTIVDEPAVLETTATYFAAVDDGDAIAECDEANVGSPEETRCTPLH